MCRVASSPVALSLEAQSHMQDDGRFFRRRGEVYKKTFQNWLSMITGAGQALDMSAYTGADVSVETRTSSYAKAQETPKG